MSFVLWLANDLDAQGLKLVNSSDCIEAFWLIEQNFIWNGEH